MGKLFSIVGKIEVHIVLNVPGVLTNSMDSLMIKCFEIHELCKTPR